MGVVVMMMMMIIKLIVSLYKMPLYEGLSKLVTSLFAMFRVKAEKDCANNGECFFFSVR